MITHVPVTVHEVLWQKVEASTSHWTKETLLNHYWFWVLNLSEHHVSWIIPTKETTIENTWILLSSENVIFLHSPDVWCTYLLANWTHFYVRSVRNCFLTAVWHSTNSICWWYWKVWSLVSASDAFPFKSATWLPSPSEVYGLRKDKYSITGTRTSNLFSCRL